MLISIKKNRVIKANLQNRLKFYSENFFEYVIKFIPDIFFLLYNKMAKFFKYLLVTKKTGKQKFSAQLRKFSSKKRSFLLVV